MAEHPPGLWKVITKGPWRSQQDHCADTDRAQPGGAGTPASPWCSGLLLGTGVTSPLLSVLSFDMVLIEKTDKKKNRKKKAEKSQKKEKKSPWHSGDFPLWTCRISMNIVFCKHFVTILVS